MNTSDAVTLLSSIAQDARLNIFRLLVQAGAAGVPAGNISETLHIPSSTLSFHLKELSNAGLITPKQEGRFVFYSANYEKMNDLLGFLTENCCAGIATDTDTNTEPSTCTPKNNCC